MRRVARKHQSFSTSWSSTACHGIAALGAFTMSWLHGISLRSSQFVSAKLSMNSPGLQYTSKTRLLYIALVYPDKWQSSVTSSYKSCAEAGKCVRAVSATFDAVPDAIGMCFMFMQSRHRGLVASVERVLACHSRHRDASAWTRCGACWNSSWG